MTMTAQPRGGRWPWRELVPDTPDGALELYRRATEAGYSRTVAGGFLGWLMAVSEGRPEGERRTGTETRYRRMLVELSPAEKLEHLTTAA